MCLLHVVWGTVSSHSTPPSAHFNYGSLGVGTAFDSPCAFSVRKLGFRVLQRKMYNIYCYIFQKSTHIQVYLYSCAMSTPQALYSAAAQEARVALAQPKTHMMLAIAMPAHFGAAITQMIHTVTQDMAAVTRGWRPRLLLALQLRCAAYRTRNLQMRYTRHPHRF